MRSQLPPLALVALLMAPTSAGAAFHLWDITEVYSNADGSVQYIELFTTANFEDLLAGHNIRSNTRNFVFTTDLPSSQTANRHFLIATPAFAAQCNSPFQPDYTFASGNFHSLVADMLDFDVVDAFDYGAGELPTDGYNSLHEDFGDITGATRAVEPNSPTNFAGQVCLPEPSGWPMQVAGLVGVLGLARWRRRRARR